MNFGITVLCLICTKHIDYFASPLPEGWGLSFWIKKYEHAIEPIRAKDSKSPHASTENVEAFCVMKPFEAGTNIEFKELDDKILITAKNKTRIKEGNFSLEADEIIIESGPGIKISSKGKDTLVISADLKKMEESLYDFNKRLVVMEKSLVNVLNILKALKVTQ